MSAEQVEQGAGQQYRQMLQQASGQSALAPKDHPQLQRLRYIAERIIPFTPECNGRARDWNWEVNLIGSHQLNAFCMPGGKIAFFYGILAKLQLTDDEVATIMGHEVAHALLEHAREQMGKNVATQTGLRLGAALLGLGNLGDMAAQMGSQVLSLTYSRDDESEADALGLDDVVPRWLRPARRRLVVEEDDGGERRQESAQVPEHAPDERDRIKDIEGSLPRVLPMYEAADKPTRDFGPPPKPPSR